MTVFNALSYTSRGTTAGLYSNSTFHIWKQRYCFMQLYFNPYLPLPAPTPELILPPPSPRAISKIPPLAKLGFNPRTSDSNTYCFALPHRADSHLQLGLTSLYRRCCSGWAGSLFKATQLLSDRWALLSQLWCLHGAPKGTDRFLKMRPLPFLGMLTTSQCSVPKGSPSATRPVLQRGTSTRIFGLGTFI